MELRHAKKRAHNDEVERSRREEGPMKEMKKSRRGESEVAGFRSR